MDTKNLEFTTPECIEQLLMEQKLNYFTYNRGVSMDGDTARAQIELKGAKHGFMFQLAFDTGSKNLTITLQEATGEPPEGAPEKILAALTDANAKITAVFIAG